MTASQDQAIALNELRLMEVRMRHDQLIVRAVQHAAKNGENEFIRAWCDLAIAAAGEKP